MSEFDDMNLPEDLFAPPSDDAPQTTELATVVAVDLDGVQLRLDGEDKATDKRYKYLMSARGMLPNDRVILWRIAGTAIVVGVIGPTGRTDGDVHAATADYATEAGHAKTADQAATASWAAQAANADRANSTSHADLADQATLAVRAANADDASRATIALRVSNGGSQSEDINFRYYSGKIQGRYMTGAWQDLS